MKFDKVTKASEKVDKKWDALLAAKAVFATALEARADVNDEEANRLGKLEKALASATKKLAKAANEYAEKVNDLHTVV